MPNSSASNISRRTLLRGIGVSMALPWLESLSFAAGDKTAADQPPTRTLVTFTGMGFHSAHWWAKGEGAGMELGPCLKPLEPWKERLVFLRGLWNEQANKGRHPLHADWEHAERCAVVGGRSPHGRQFRSGDGSADWRPHANPVAGAGL